MIYESDIRSLLSQWEERLKKDNNPYYNDALYDCIYDLRNTLDKLSYQEAEALTYEDAFEDMMTDQALIFDRWANEFYVQ